MSDNIPPAKQRVCAELYREDEKYILDIYSCVQPEHHGLDGLRKQIILFITRAKQNNRSTFLQEEKISLGMIKVHSDQFCWKRTEDASTLIVKLNAGDFEAVRKIERKKIDEMRLPEKVTYILPCCDASAMKINAKLLNEGPVGETLLETEQLSVTLFLIPHCETRVAVEHEHVYNQASEQSSYEHNFLSRNVST